MGFYDSIYNSFMGTMRVYFAVMLVVYFVMGCIFAFACRSIVKGKGYPDETCFHNAIGGFFLGMIWVIVCACKPVCSDNWWRNEDNSNFFSAPSSEQVFWIVFSAGLMMVTIGSAIAVVISLWGLVLSATGIVLWIVQYTTIGKTRQ